MAHNHLADIRAGRITATNIIGIRNIPWQAALAYGLESGPTVQPE